jgi:hypothetical protein
LARTSPGLPAQGEESRVVDGCIAVKAPSFLDLGSFNKQTQSRP